MGMVKRLFVAGRQNTARPINYSSIFCCYIKQLDYSLLISLFVLAVCKIPSIFENGIISVEKFDNEGVIELFCHHGYKMSGSHVLQCVSGQWNDSIPQCLEGKISTSFAY